MAPLLQSHTLDALGPLWELGAYGAVLCLLALALLWMIRANSKMMRENLAAERRQSQIEREEAQQRAQEQHETIMHQSQMLNKSLSEFSNTMRGIQHEIHELRSEMRRESVQVRHAIKQLNNEQH
jgi:type VI protein secretion system component VasK